MKNISPNARGASFGNVGPFTIIEDDVVMFGVTVGSGCLIEKGVKIGSGTRIRNNVELRKGTIIGKDCYIDSGVKTSGDCTIGDNVTIRFDSIICREATIENGVFIAPKVMTQYSDFKGNNIPGILIKEGAKIGTGCVIAPGVTVGQDAETGTLTYIRENVPDSWKVYNKQHQTGKMKYTGLK